MRVRIVNGFAGDTVRRPSSADAVERRLVDALGLYRLLLNEPRGHRRPFRLEG